MWVESLGPLVCEVKRRSTRRSDRTMIVTILESTENSQLLYLTYTVGFIGGQRSKSLEVQRRLRQGSDHGRSNDTTDTLNEGRDSSAHRSGLCGRE